MLKRVSIAFASLALFFLTGVSSLASSDVAWKSTLYFRAGSSSVSVSESALSEIDAMLSSLGEGKVAGIRVRTYSSPEGSYNWNSRLASKRSDAVLDLLKQRCPSFPDSLVKVENVAEDWKSAEVYVRYSDKPWKEEALQLLRSGKGDLEERMQDLWGGVVWDELLWNCFTRIRRTEIEFISASNTQFSQSGKNADPGESPAAAPSISAPLQFVFPVGKTALSDSGQLSSPSAEALSAFIEKLPSDATVFLDAFSSPEGRASWNKVLARKRAESVKARLISLGVPADRITVRSCEENWSGLRDFVASSYPGAEKDEILSVIDNRSIDDDVREQKLSAIAGGRPWQNLLAGAMSPLRVVKISL